MILLVNDIYLIKLALRQVTEKHDLFDRNNFAQAQDLLKRLSDREFEGISLPEEKAQASSDQIRSNHYGGVDNPYEAIKVIDAWNANFNLGNAIKYICRVCIRDNTPYGNRKETDNKGIQKHIEDLKKARTYLDFEIEKMEKI